MERGCSNPLEIQQYLQSAQYLDIARTLEDIVQLRRSYGDLRAWLRPFVYNDGSERMRVSLRGTIPVNMRGTVYNIPVVLHIDHGHPRVAPMCFVEPTETMQVAPGPNVDPTGLIKHDVLWRWHESHSSLVNLVSQICYAFAERTPVFSVASRGVVGGSTSSTGNTGGARYTQPPYQPVQQQYGQRQQQPAHNPPPVQQAAMQASGVAPPRYEPAPRDDDGPAATTLGVGGDDDPKRISSDIVRMSCLSAATDNVVRKLSQLHSKSSARITESQRRADALASGQLQLADIKARLQSEQRRVVDALTWYESSIKRATTETEHMAARAKNNDVDGAIVPTRALYGQAMELEAQDQALSDVLYTLQEAMVNGAGGGGHTSADKLQKLLLSVGNVSREQYMVRYTLKRVHAALA